jgi:hypothetical protein
MIMRHVVSPSDAETISVSYSFEYDIYESVPHDKDRSRDHAGEDFGQYLKPGVPEEFIPRIDAIIRRVAPDASASPYQRVRSLYNWVWDSFEFLEVPGAQYELINTGYSACLPRIRLLISLVRLAGVPIREQTGVYFGDGIYTGPSMDYFQQTIGTTPFVHTWAEFFTPEYGWLPVSDFEAPARIASMAVMPEDERQQFIRGSRRRCRAVFGSLEPFRIYGGEASNKLPTFPIVKTMQGWQPDDDLTASTLHTVRCHMEQI